MHRRTRLQNDLTTPGSLPPGQPRAPRGSGSICKLKPDEHSHPPLASLSPLLQNFHVCSCVAERLRNRDNGVQVGGVSCGRLREADVTGLCELMLYELIIIFSVALFVAMLMINS